MENKRVETHPVWEDVGSFGLGVLIALTPAITGGVSVFTRVILGEGSYSAPIFPGNESGAVLVALITVLIGFLVAIAAVIERIQVLENAQEPAREWEELMEAALGVLLIALPFIFGYAGTGTLRYWHFALGACLLLLALFQLRRDWGGEIASHSDSVAAPVL